MSLHDFLIFGSFIFVDNLRSDIVATSSSIAVCWENLHRLHRDRFPDKWSPPIKWHLNRRNRLIEMTAFRGNYNCYIGEESAQWTHLSFHSPVRSRRSLARSVEPYIRVWNYVCLICNTTWHLALSVSTHDATYVLWYWEYSCVERVKTGPGAIDALVICW